MTTKMSLTYNDYSNEKSVLTLHFAQIAGDGSNFASLLTAMNAVEATIDAITLCDNSKQAFYDELSEGVDIPTNPFAQRELGLRIFCRDDSTSKPFYFTIPGPDLAALTIVSGSDQVTLADGDVMAALVAAVEADCLSPDGNAVTVETAYVVGRRS